MLIFKNFDRFYGFWKSFIFTFFSKLTQIKIRHKSPSRGFINTRVRVFRNLDAGRGSWSSDNIWRDRHFPSFADYFKLVRLVENCAGERVRKQTAFDKLIVEPFLDWFGHHVITANFDKKLIGKNLRKILLVRVNCCEDKHSIVDAVLSPAVETLLVDETRARVWSFFSNLIWARWANWVLVAIYLSWALSSASSAFSVRPQALLSSDNFIVKADYELFCVAGWWKSISISSLISLSWVDSIFCSAIAFVFPYRKR